MKRIIHQDLQKNINNVLGNSTHIYGSNNLVQPSIEVVQVVPASIVSYLYATNGDRDKDLQILLANYKK